MLVRLLARDSGSPHLIPVLGPIQEFDGPLPRTASSLPWSRGSIILMATLTNTQQVNVEIRAKNRRGGPAGLQSPEWSTDNSDVLRLEPHADGQSCRIVAAGPIGTANVTMQADADLGDGVQPVVGTLSFDITPGTATVIDLVPGPPEEQPDEVLTPTGGGETPEVTGGGVEGTPGEGSTVPDQTAGSETV
jgi:hypothetical protein